MMSLLYQILVQLTNIYDHPLSAGFILDATIGNKTLKKILPFVPFSST